MNEVQSPFVNMTEVERTTTIGAALYGQMVQQKPFLIKRTHDNLQGICQKTHERLSDLEK